MKRKAIILFLAIYILFLTFHFIDNRQRVKKSEYKIYQFYMSPINWKVLDKYIDTNEHMGRTLNLTPISKDSQFRFIPSGLRLSPFFYDNLEVGDTILKNERSLLILIKNGKKHELIQNDTSHLTIEFLSRYKRK